MPEVVTCSVAPAPQVASDTLDATSETGIIDAEYDGAATVPTFEGIFPRQLSKLIPTVPPSVET
jgi:hypothetical protein